MAQNKIVVLVVVGALAVGGVAGFFVANRGYNNVAVVPEGTPPAATWATAQKPACDGPKSIGLDDIYAKRSVSYAGASGTTVMISDECADAGRKVNKAYCYESPPNTGNFVPGRVVYDCVFGCEDGACRRLAASSTFSYPYPITWSEGEAKLDLTGVSIGEVTSTSNLVYSDGRSYAEGTKIYGLVLHIKISNGMPPSSYGQTTVPLNIRRLVNEEGDLDTPATAQFYFSTGGNLIEPNATYRDQKVVFVVPATDKQFEFTTGGTSNIFFSVTVQDDGTIKAEPEATNG